MIRAAFLATLLCAASCRTLPTAPSLPSEDPDFERPAAPLEPGMASDPEPAERVLPGDMLGLKTVSVAPLDLPDLTVDNAGFLHVPVAGPVEVKDKTIEEASVLVEQALHRYDSRAQVQLRIIAPTGHHATVLGAVTTQGVYPLTAGMRVADLLAKAGGPLQQVDSGEQVALADLDGARVMRRGKPLPISVALALEGDPLHNVLIHADDLVILPPARGMRITMLGQVHTPRTIPFRTSLRLTDAVAMAGGITEVGDDGDVRVIRGPLSHPRIYRASISALYNGEAHDVVLQPGDVVMVTETFFGNVTDVLARMMPMLLIANLVRAFSQ